MNLTIIRDALLTVSDKVYHYFAPPNAKAPYIVWAEDGEGKSKWSDNKKSWSTTTGTIDFFTKTEYDETVEKIEKALDSIDIVWTLNSVQYEDDTKLIHLEWVWEIG